MVVAIPACDNFCGAHGEHLGFAAEIWVVQRGAWYLILRKNAVYKGKFIVEKSIHAFSSYNHFSVPARDDVFFKFYRSDKTDRVLCEVLIKQLRVLDRVVDYEST